MGEGTAIEWADHTFNPWWGCARVSPACDHCYAETFSHRLGMDLWQKGGERRHFGDAHWRAPLKWNARAGAAGVRDRVFCASMADVFEDHDDVGADRHRLWQLIEATPQLDWLLLTKRPQNIARMAPWDDEWPANVWVGTTVENQRYADLRVRMLLEVPARVRFLSVEPMLGPIELAQEWLVPSATVCGRGPSSPESASALSAVLRMVGEQLGGRYVDWIICGGESGHGHRPIEPDWVRHLRDQSTAAGVPFLFKQWGGRTPKVGGRELDGRTWDEVPA